MRRVASGKFLPANVSSCHTSTQISPPLIGKLFLRRLFFFCVLASRTIIDFHCISATRKMSEFRLTEFSERLRLIGFRSHPATQEEKKSEDFFIYTIEPSTAQRTFRTFKLKLKMFCGKFFRFNVGFSLEGLWKDVGVRTSNVVGIFVSLCRALQLSAFQFQG